MEDTKEEVKKEKVKIKISFFEAMKFGIGFGVGLFLWGLILMSVALLLLDRYLQGVADSMPGMSF